MTLLSNYAGNQITRAGSALSKSVYKTYLAGLSSNAAGQVTLSSNNNISSTQYLAKLDHTLSEKNHLSVRYFYNQDNFQRLFTAPTGFFAANYFRNQSLALSDTHVFSPTLTGTLTISAGRFARTQVPQAPGSKSLQDLGQKVALGMAVPLFPGIRFNISGFVNIFSGGTLTQATTTFYERVAFVKVLGAHTISFGGDFERSRINANDFSFTPGGNVFSGARTGNAASDFYLEYELTQRVARSPSSSCGRWSPAPRDRRGTATPQEPSAQPSTGTPAGSPPSKSSDRSEEATAPTEAQGSA